MKNNKFLKPLFIKNAEDLEKNLQLTDNFIQYSYRGYRDSLKHYLSVNSIKSSNSKKKTFELTENNLHGSTSPRIVQRLQLPVDNQPYGKEKYLENIVAIKRANKSVLKALHSMDYKKDNLKASPFVINIPDELKQLNTENISERSEATKMLEWFESMEKTELQPLFTIKKLLDLSANEQDKVLNTAESIILLSLTKVIEAVKTHCSEKAIMIQNIFNSYKKYWEAFIAINKIKQENLLKDIAKDIDNQKSEFISLKKSSRSEISTLKKSINDLQYDIKLKELEIERLTRNVNGLKNERSAKIKKELETYEKMIEKIKQKMKQRVLDTTDNYPFDKYVHKYDQQFKNTVLAELHLAEKFKDKILNMSDSACEDQKDLKELKEEEESLIELSKFVSVYTDMSITMDDKETYIGFVYFDEETQTDLYNEFLEPKFDTKRPSFDITNEIFTLQQDGLVPEDAEIVSWSAGYYTGLEKGRRLSVAEAIEAEEKLVHAEESDDSFDKSFKLDDNYHNNEELDKLDNEIVKRDDKKKKHRTRVKEFVFNKREKPVQQKIAKSKRIREIIMKKSQERIKARAKMSKKMLVKAMNSIVSGLLQKYKQEDFSDDVLELMYIDLESKYSSKKVLYKKILDLICNLISYSDMIKAQTILRFIELSEKINIPPLAYKKDSLMIYLSGFDTITKSKTGIMPGVDDMSENYLVPLVRCTDFFRERFTDLFPPSRLSRGLEFLERNSVYDPKRIHKSGIIDLEIVLHYAIDQYEDHCAQVYKTGLYLIKAINCQNAPELIKKSDLVHLANTLKTNRHLKDNEILNHELIDIDKIFAGPTREIFPEEFADTNDLTDFENLLELIRSSNLPWNNKYLDLFENYGRSLDRTVFPYIKKILEINAKTLMN